jgi:hypothetical protein
MARGKSTPLRTALSRLFPAALLRRLARETGTVQRRRRVDPVTLFWIVVLGVGSGERSFADQAAQSSTSGHTVAGMIQTTAPSTAYRGLGVSMRDDVIRRIRRRTTVSVVAVVMASVLASCYPVARARMAVRVLVKVDHADGKPAAGIPLWHIDRTLKSAGNSADFSKAPTCRTDARGECSVMVVYHYCETVFSWRMQARRD